MVDEANHEILEIFRNAEINTPLLNVIKQVPHYTKFLKELCTVKHTLKRNKK